MKPTCPPEDTGDDTGTRRDGRCKLTGLKSSVKLLADAISRELGKRAPSAGGSYCHRPYRDQPHWQL